MYEPGSGTPKSIVINPAAGADALWVVPQGKAWRVCLTRALLNTSAVVNTRITKVLVYDPDGNVVLSVYSGMQLGAGTTQYLSGAIYLQPVGNAGSSGNLTSLPDIVLKAGWKLGYSAYLMDVADQWTNCVAYVEEFSD